MKYLILDEETETHTKYKRKANPFLKQNYIVARGWKKEGDRQCSHAFYDNAEQVPELKIDDDVDVIVAHNAKFEYLYEKRFSPITLHNFFKRGGRMWCTQYAEYLINGQIRKYHMNSLDQIAPKYGGRVKTDGVKELWDAGYQTSEIDRDLLRDYLIGTKEEKRNSGDIGNTELVYKGQVKAAKELGMYQALLLRMDGLCATADMEYHGLKIDVERARSDLKKRKVEFTAAEQELSIYLTDLPEGFKFNWNSGIHKSAIIFGGTVKYEKSDTYIDPATGKLARLVSQERWPLFDKEPHEPHEDWRDWTDEHGNWFSQRVRYTEEDKYVIDLKSRGVNSDIVEEFTAWKVQDCNVGGKNKGAPKFRNVRGWGDLKTKIQPFFHKFDGYTVGDDDWLSSLTDGVGGPVYSTSSDTVDRVTKRGSNIPFLKALGTFNRLKKEIGTYYYTIDSKGKPTGMLTCVQPEDHIIHPKLNHTSTVTTRLSSSDPNLQNLTRADFDKETGLYKSEVKAMFVSRFGLMAGRMVEIDYSQLEVVVQGFLSGDTNLVKDLNNNVDFHCKRMSLKNSINYEDAVLWCTDEDHPDHAKWKKERTKCKIFSFQRAYGAGATLIADETGMSVDEVKELIGVEEAEYPGVTKYNATVEAEVNETATPFKDKERGFRVFRSGNYQAPTGTLYSFRSYDAPDYIRKRGILDTFSPTEMKNYPVQGTGGELVQMVLGQLWRWFVKNDFWGGRAFLVNTVHDCVWADCHDDVVDEVTAGMIKIMQAIPHFLKHFFDIDCPVRFPVDAEIGTNMLELKHWKDRREL